MKIPSLFFARLLCVVGAAAFPQDHAHWVGSWSASQQLVEPQNLIAPADIRDTTLRQIVHLSIGGSTIRLHVSNRFSATALHLTSLHIARPVSSASSKIVPETDVPVHFSGAADV